MAFKDQIDGGKKLSIKLKHYKGDPNAIVLGIPRGGVITANEVAKFLNLPLDIIVVKKITAPGDENQAVGVINENGEGVFDRNLINSLAISPKQIQAKTDEQIRETNRLIAAYHGDRKPLDLSGKTAILIDDGVNTGHTMLAAIMSARKKGAEKVVVATPVIAQDTLGKIKNKSDELIYLNAPAFFGSVDSNYNSFNRIEDDEIRKILG